MLPNFRRLIIGIPALVLLWAVSNSLGVTAALTTALGLPDLDYFDVPAIPQVVHINEDAESTNLVDGLLSAAEERLGGGSGEALDEDRVAEAITQAEALTVKGRAPKTGYSREEFGATWTDAVDVELGRNGCDTRNDILGRDLDHVEHKPGTGDCKVLTGTLQDPYTGNSIDFVQGRTSSQAVQIDHLVALSDAWQKGAQQWPQEKRTELANDPANLLAVDGPTNSSKGDADVATWLPPNKPHRCEYVAQVVGVKAAYDIWVTQAEQDAMIRVLSTTC
ncbi:HNH endonuclease family protein [Aeromicrobium sp. CTD01-1L150]|uniref:HNH endonuclease family protein n=1 Tax=Aeromicrobium sp. CTD01-1L150 TaxID=3341830 RepID=UPI0035C01365